MIYTRGPKDDYERLASMTGDSGWNWKNMDKYFRKVCLLPSFNLMLPFLLFLVIEIILTLPACTLAYHSTHPSWRTSRTPRTS